MMLAGEVLAMTDITNEMVARGDISDATYICRAMAENGHEVSSSALNAEVMPAAYHLWPCNISMSRHTWRAGI